MRVADIFYMYRTLYIPGFDTFPPSANERCDTDPEVAIIVD
jgi:hypothetical protein